MITADEFRIAMKQKNMSLVSLSETLNVDRTTIYNWLKKWDDLRKSERDRLCKAVGLEIEDEFKNQVNEPMPHYRLEPNMELSLKILENQAKMLDRLERIEKLLTQK